MPVVDMAQYTGFFTGWRFRSAVRIAFVPSAQTVGSSIEGKGFQPFQTGIEPMQDIIISTERLFVEEVVGLRETGKTVWVQSSIDLMFPWIMVSCLSRTSAGIECEVFKRLVSLGAERTSAVQV